MRVISADSLPVCWSMSSPQQNAHGVSTAETVGMALTPEQARLLRKAGEKVAEWTRERDRLIREAVDAGASLRDVGEAVGLSHTAVKFIAKGRPER